MPSDLFQHLFLLPIDFLKYLFRYSAPSSFTLPISSNFRYPIRVEPNECLFLNELFHTVVCKQENFRFAHLREVDLLVVLSYEVEGEIEDVTL